MIDFGLQHPWFRPMWRRYAVSAVCIGWAIFEFMTGNAFWGVVFGSIGAVAVKQLFFDPWPEDDDSQSSN